MSKELRKPGPPSKIEKYGLMDHAVNLLKVQPKLSYAQIAEELNSIGNVPEEEKITATNVQDFARVFPEIRREILLANRAHMRKLILEGAEFDILHTLKDMAARFSFMIDSMEQMAIEEGKLPDPVKYKALSSELRETLKQIENIHKEVYDMEVVREFMLEVVKTLKEVSPEALQKFIEKMKGKRDNSNIVHELLKGGIKA